jgi:hypothetical protein
VNGPVEVRLRIRVEKKGIGHLQWRTEGQDTFPKQGQNQSFDLSEGEWQEVSLPLNAECRLVHVRLFVSDSMATEIDWIEIGDKATPTRNKIYLPGNSSPPSYCP